MKTTALIGLPMLVLALGLSFSPQAESRASILALPDGGQPVNVSVGFNTQFALTDLSHEGLANAQKTARELIYRMGASECALLEATIAETCRLTNLNVNSQIQQRNRNQPYLHVNGNANFTISLKSDAAGAELPPSAR